MVLHCQDSDVDECSAGHEYGKTGAANLISPYCTHMERSVVSKAADKSNQVRAVTLSLSIAVKISCYVQRRRRVITSTVPDTSLSQSNTVQSQPLFLMVRRLYRMASEGLNASVILLGFFAFYMQRKTASGSSLSIHIQRRTFWVRCMGIR